MHKMRDSKRDKNHKKNQTEIVNIKNTINEMKNEMKQRASTGHSIIR